MKQTGVVFYDWEIRAFLAGTKTQFRRVIKPAQVERCPFHPGDLIWAKEALFWESYASNGYTALDYLLDHEEVIAEIPVVWNPPVGYSNTHWEGGDNIPGGGFYWSDGTVPARCMPRWASRISREIVSIRAERLQDIIAADAEAEGVVGKTSASPVRGHPYEEYRNGDGLVYPSPRAAYIPLWNSNNEKKGDPWSANPWVWVVSFKAVE